MTGVHYSRFLHGDRGAHVLVIPHDVAVWLYYQCKLRDVREPADADVSAVLTALALAAAETTAAGSSTTASGAGVAGQLQQQLNTRAAADQLGITPRAITLAISQGRLAATKRDGRWLIARHDLDRYHR